MSTLRATYRLQFEPSFRFADAAALAPLLAAVGISHVYASPVFEAVPGSRHGYDVIDPGQVRDELGGGREWRRLIDAHASHGLGVIADIVPNHLSFSDPITVFHDAVRRWQRERPLGLRNTSTHDPKRSEDVRARLTVISERVDQWIAQVTARHERFDTVRIDGQPDTNFEYHLYQTLVGAWPLSRERAHIHAEKAAREAKLFTNWTTPSPEYEEAIHRFIDGLYDDARFGGEVEALVATLHPGDWYKALAPLVLKITTPDVPDFYQGALGWMLTISDPDNRRPVDDQPLQAALASLDTLTPEEIAARLDEGLPKVWVTQRALELKRRNPALAASAADEPLSASGGDKASHVVAFLRGGEIAVVVPTRTIWNGRQVFVDRPTGTWADVLTNRDVAGGKQSVCALWRTFPAALLERRAA